MQFINKTTSFLFVYALLLFCTITDKANAMFVSTDYDLVKKMLRTSREMS